MDTDLTNKQRNNSHDHGGETPSYFISYSHQDREAVEKIWRGIQTGPQKFQVSFDRSILEPGAHIAPEIEKAIGKCNVMLFLASRSSVTSRYCRNELALAYNKGKKIVPLRLHSGIELPIQIQDAQYIDFSTSFEGGLEKLYSFLARSRRESPPPPVANEPAGIAYPSFPVSAHFLGRSKEQQDIEKFISTDGSAVLWIRGRAGCGKTALICHVLNRIRHGEWISPERKVPIHAVVYLDREHQSRRDWFDVLHTFRGFSDTTPRPYSQKGYLASAVEQVLSGLSNRRVVLLVDHLDDLIDLETRNLTKPILRDALQAVLTITAHKLKVIVTSQLLPSDLPTVQSGRLCVVDLDAGLPQAEALQLLKQLGQDKNSGLQDGNDKLLAELCRRAQNNPRAIEKLHAIFQQDHDTSIQDILQHEKEFLPRAVLDTLIGESYTCLDAVSKTMMQVLSVSETAITAEGVVSVFRQYHPDIDARQVLSRLVNIQLVKKKNDCYQLRVGDGYYVASQLVDGTSSTLGGPDGVHLNRFTLCQQYADYFKQVASTHDTTAEAELLIKAFHHHCNGKDYVAAVDILKRLEPHLFEQGRYQEVAQYYEQLDGKLEDHKLIRHRLDALARIYQRLGKLDRAAVCYEGGLIHVRSAHDLRGECRYLANLALCKQESGDLMETTLYCMAALELARQAKDNAVEAHIWNIISDSLASLGQLHIAAEASQRGLELARNNFPRETEVGVRINLGQHYEALGDSTRAQEECDRACRIVSTTRFQLGESAARRNLGILKLSQRKFKLAAEEFSKAMKLADITQSVQLQQTIRIELALSLLLGGELSEAEATISEALRYDTPLFSSEAHSLHGVILQRQGNAIEAVKSFSYALEQAQGVLKRTSGYYRVLDAMGLSYCGLTLSQNELYLDEAIEAYQASCLLTHAPGIVRRRYQLFEALAQTDPEKKLASVRTTIDPKA